MTSGLVKKASGLPRFMMDCGFWRSRKWAGSGLDEIGLQAAAVSYCYEHSTDGMLPGPDVGDLAAALGVREREAERAVAKMLKSKRWARRRSGYEIVGYLDHNPSAAEVDEFRTERASSGAKGNHVRWHKDKIDPDCEFCSKKERSQRNGKRDRNSDRPSESLRIARRVEESRGDVTHASHGEEQLPSSSRQGVASDDETTDGVLSRVCETVLTEAFEILAERALDRRNSDLTRRHLDAETITTQARRKAWKAEAARREREIHERLARTYFAQDPGLTASALADVLDDPIAVAAQEAFHDPERLEEIDAIWDHLSEPA